MSREFAKAVWYIACAAIGVEIGHATFAFYARHEAKVCASGLAVTARNRLDSLFVMTSFSQCDFYTAPWEKKP